MGEGWERPPRVAVDLDERNQLVAKAFPGKTVSEFSVLASGFANTNLRFRLEGLYPRPRRLQALEPAARALRHGLGVRCTEVVNETIRVLTRSAALVQPNYASGIWVWMAAQATGALPVVFDTGQRSCAVVVPAATPARQSEQPPLGVQGPIPVWDTTAGMALSLTDYGD